MSAQTTAPPVAHTRLTGEEWRLLCELREVPPGPLRTKLFGLLFDLVAYVREPQCPEAQADGVPCASTSVACDQCRPLEPMIDALRIWVRES
jgi:hypothetical protein